MAVNNRLAAKAAKNSNAVEYEAGGMKVRLTPEIVRNYLVSGNKEAVSIQELAMFMNLCKYSQLNPWAKEAYCIKYGSEPAAMVVSKEAFQKRSLAAMRKFGERTAHTVHASRYPLMNMPAERKTVH